MASISPLFARIFDDPEAVRARIEREKIRTRHDFRRKAKRGRR